jgi:peroxiredoxin 2/4
MESNEETDKKREGIPLIGDRFPEMKVQTTQGQLKLPLHYNGKWFVLFSHPADFTPVCTTEFVAFQKNYARFRNLDCELIGLSVDQVFSHINWIRWIKEKLNIEIEFPVIADNGDISEIFGLIHPGIGASKVRLGVVHPGIGTNTVRAVIIVDDQGIIRAILYYPEELGRNTNEILRMVKGMQLADKKSVAIPANWPENELFGDHVIIPPPKTLESAQQRLNISKSGSFEYIDWWLCHEKPD